MCCWLLHTLTVVTRLSLRLQVFEAQTLGMKDGEMVPQEFGMVGTNSIGMLAWLCKLKTPEYPEGREIVIITNDVTIMNGSFGVREDEFFEQVWV